MIPEKCFIKFFQQFTLKSTSIILRCYDGTEIVPEGEFHAEVTYGDEHFEKCRFLVVKKGSVPLLGRDLIKLLKMKIDLSEKSIPVNVLNTDVDEDLKDILTKYKELFNNELGRYKYEKIQ